jgi:RHS repeat-associated protein
VVIPDSCLSPVHDGECSSIAYHVSGLSEQLTLGSRLEITLSGAPVDAADLPCEPGAASEYVVNLETELDKAIAGIGLNYFGVRFYDPVTGVWFSTDPAGQFHSGYSYTGNGINPIVGIDNDGTVINIFISNIQTGKYYVINRYTEPERGKNPKLQQETRVVPLYLAIYRNESGTIETMQLTRDAIGGQGTFTETGTFRGAVRREGGLGWRIELREMYGAPTEGNPDKNPGMLYGYGGPRYANIQIHAGKCSKGCFLVPYSILGNEYYGTYREARA